MRLGRPLAAGRLWALCLLLLCCLSGCQTLRRADTPRLTGAPTGYLSAKIQLVVPSRQRDALLAVDGTARLLEGRRLHLSFQMPLVRAEVARVEVTPDSILLVDRHDKRYVRTTFRELQGTLPAGQEAGFDRLQKMFLDASRPGGKNVLTGRDFALPELEEARLTLTDFSDKEFSLVPARLSSRYEEVGLYELLDLLMNL